MVQLLPMQNHMDRKSPLPLLGFLLLLPAIVFFPLKSPAQQVNWTYDQLARTPNAYAGWTLTFSGKVVQVMQEERGDTTLRIAISPDGRNSIMYVEYRASSPSEPRILENDIVDVRGKFVGIKSYKAVAGNIIQVPHVIACEVRSTPRSTIRVLRAPQQPVPCDPGSSSAPRT